MTTLHRVLLPAAAAAALAAAGCGGSPGNSASAKPVATNTVGMNDSRFDPPAIRVRMGERITWTNDESVPHNVVANSGADFKSDTFGKGKAFSYTPARPGTIKYECTLHPGMVGTVEVAAAATQ